MNKKIKILAITILFWAILSLFSTVNAASASIKASATSVTVGKKVTVTVTIKAAAWNVTVSGSASGKIAGADMSEKNVTTIKTYTVTPKKAGKYTVKISGDVTDASGDEKTVSGSVTITAKEKTTNTDNNNNNNNNNNNADNDTKPKKSSDATLSNLGVTPKKYDFKGFRKSITGSKAEYKVKVPNDVTKLSVYATTSSSKATYSVSGNSGFKVGTNIISVKVKAEDGTTKTYKIYVTREAKEEEVVPNVTEDDNNTENENVEEQLDDIGLKSLTVKGYELDSEFQSNVFDYIVVIGDDKFDSANSVKKLITAESNYEDAEVVVKVTEGTSEDSFIYQATISVADVEKEYASYTVKFVKSLEDAEEIIEEEPVYPEDVETNTITAPVEEKELLFGYDKDTVEKLILIVCIVIMLIISIILGIIAYDKSSKLKIYEDAEEYEEALTNESNIENGYIQNTNESDINKPEETINENTQKIENVQDAKNENKEIEKNEYYSSNSDKYEPRYRNPRNINKKGGRHF